MMTRVGNLSYDKKQIIGRGTFGNVYKGCYHVIDNISGSGVPSELAVKRIDSSCIKEDVFLREVNLMITAKGHPNILHCICTERNDDFM